MSTQPSTQRTFDAPTIEEALAQVHRQLGPDALIVRADRVRKGGLGGFFAREHYEVVVETPEAPEEPEPEEPEAPLSILDLAEQVSEAEQQIAPGSPLPSTETPVFADVMRRIAGEAGLIEPAPAPPLERTIELLAEPEPEPAPEPEPEPEPEPVTFDFSAVLPATRGATDLVPIGEALRGLGLPDELVPVSCDPESLVPALLRHLRHLPAAPPLPSAPGSLTCIAGQQDEALALARRLAEDLGIDPDGVVLATPEPARRSTTLLTSPATAGEQARAWRTVGTSRVVAVATTPGSRDTRWARRMIDALVPDTVWARADARRKTEDIAAWCDALGGVDALAVQHVEETTSPASILTLNLPVTMVDEHWASATRWALLLAERVPVAA